MLYICNTYIYICGHIVIYTHILIYVYRLYEHKIILSICTIMYYIACMKSKTRMSKDFA